MQPTLAYPELLAAAALLQLPWIFQDSLPSATVPLNVHAHLSAFSSPRWSYHAFSCGSVSISLSSWPLTLPSAASASLCPVLESPGSQPGSPSSQKKNPNWTWIPLIVPLECH